MQREEAEKLVKLLADEETQRAVSLEDIHSLQEMRLPGAYLAQRPLVERQVVSLQKSDATTWPPVLLTRTEEGWLMVDGSPRLEAGKRQGESALPAPIRSSAWRAG